MTLVLLVEALRSGSLVVLGTLLRASLEAAVVAAIVWGVCRAVPRLPAAVRVWLWWLVSVKLLLGLAPLPGVPLPVLPTAMLTSPGATRDVVIPTVSPTGTTRTVSAPAATPVEAQPVSIPYASLWPLLLVIAWGGITAVHALGLARALGNARHLRRHAEPAHATVITRLAQLVRAFGSPVMPGVFASRLTSVPLLTGIVRPAILLPAASTPALSRTELDLVLGHELAHVRRGDLAWGWVPAIASRVFFFDPLARFAAREYLAAREEACDAEVLQTLDAAPAEYGQLLVKLGVATTDDVLAAAGSSPTFAMLKRRLIMLDRSRTPASRWWWTLAGAMAVLLPLTLVAQPAPPAAPQAPEAPVAPRAYASAWVPPPPAPPEPPPVPDVPDEALLDVDIDDVPPVPPMPPAASVAPLPPMPPMPPASAVWAVPAVPPVPPAPPAPPAYQENSGRSGRQNDTPWVLLEPDNHNVMSGSRADKAAAERYRRSSNESLLWFRYKGKEYVSYDPATIQAVRDAFGPVNAVGDEMGRVGGRMGAQGGKQGEIGARQGELGARQAELAAVTTKIAAEQAARHAAQAAAIVQAREQIAEVERTATSDAERQAQREQVRLERERMRQEHQMERAKVDAEMKALGDQQRALGEEMRKLGEGMEVHSAEMKHLSGKMEEALAAAQVRVASLFDSAVASGKAKAVQ